MKPSSAIALVSVMPGTATPLILSVFSVCEITSFLLEHPEMTIREENATAVQASFMEFLFMGSPRFNS